MVNLHYSRVVRRFTGYPWHRLAFAAALATTLWGKEGRSQSDKPDPYELLDQLGQALSVVENEYHQPADQAELLRGAIRGMVSELDPHSAYLNRRDLKLFVGSTSGQFGGIGVEVEFNEDEIIVISPVEGSPADRAGIRTGDRIVALDGQPLHGLKPHDIVAKMRGKIGTKLKLSVRAEDDNTVREVVLTREQISVSSVRPILMKGNVAYFRIKAFQENTHTELLEALGQLRKSASSFSGVILDLRNNPGGLVREATAVADEFLSEGVIFSTRHRGRILRVEKAHAGGAWSDGALVVLINEYSASAAELVAGALKDQGRARLVGARSFGKGSVQTLLPLGHGGALKLTTALYFTPSGKTVQAQGITPHVTIDPGYVEGTMQALKESDLEGHLGEGESRPGPEEPKEDGVTKSKGAPPTNRELHLGVARTIPEDPTLSADIALQRAYRLVLGLPEPAPTTRAPQRDAPTPSASDSTSGLDDDATVLDEAPVPDDAAVLDEAPDLEAP